ncbi:MAG TPA: hypothetical protein VL588_03280 [Bdellovibrionota bacterium]|nr:hypothetical protein [Bdellovibrionota bacterium]
MTPGNKPLVARGAFLLLLAASQAALAAVVDLGPSVLVVRQARAVEAGAAVDVQNENPTVIKAVPVRAGHKTIEFQLYPLRPGVATLHLMGPDHKHVRDLFLNVVGRPDQVPESQRDRVFSAESKAARGHLDLKQGVALLLNLDNPGGPQTSAFSGDPHLLDATSIRFGKWVVQLLLKPIAPGRCNLLIRDNYGGLKWILDVDVHPTPRGVPDHIERKALLSQPSTLGISLFNESKAAYIPLSVGPKPLVLRGPYEPGSRQVVGAPEVVGAEFDRGTLVLTAKRSGRSTVHVFSPNGELKEVVDVWSP